MSESKFVSGGISFFSGRKKYAKCLDTYVDKYNSVSPYAGAKCRLTENKFYEIVDQGTFHNPTNAFKTYFPMIFIKDDNEEVWGLAEEMFNMDDQYASESDINKKNEESKTKESITETHSSENDEQENLEEEEFEDEEEYEDEGEDTQETFLNIQELVAPIPQVIKKKFEEVKTVNFKLEKDWDLLIKKKFLSIGTFNYRIHSLPLAAIKEDSLKEWLPMDSLLIVGAINSYFVINNSRKGVMAKPLESNIERPYKEFSFYVESIVKNNMDVDSDLMKARIFIVSAKDLRDSLDREYLSELDDFDSFLGQEATPEFIRYERISN